MTICPVCWQESGALENTPYGVMCCRCRDLGKASPCRSCTRAMCEYCPSIHLNAYRNDGQKTKVYP